MSGYLDRAYAESFADFGDAMALPRSGGWLLRRDIHACERPDAVGCYPIFACRDWLALAADMDALEGQLVSVALVTDPFGEKDPAILARAFPDACRHYKTHHVVELGRPPSEFVDPHHRYYARRSLRAVRVELVPEPRSFLEEWTTLYGNLVSRHGLRGIKAFSDGTFARQLSMAGLTVFRATLDKHTIGAHLWMSHGDVAYSHLAAFSAEGYRFHASYALVWAAIEHFSGRCRWLDLGGVPGVGDSRDSGLAFFKKGWATGTRPVFFCGRILDPEWYRRLTNDSSPGYFPAYRRGEMVSEAS